VTAAPVSIATTQYGAEAATGLLHLRDRCDSFELNKEQNGKFCTQAWYSAEAPALAPDAQQSTQSLCHTSAPKFQCGTRGRRSGAGMA
jgi:hypothetical protein